MQRISQRAMSPRRCTKSGILFLFCFLPQEFRTIDFTQDIPEDEQARLDSVVELLLAK
jgi:hypothetical protein